MGDISRHRDIFFNTQEAIPTSLLDKCKLAAADLTYLELGNYLADVSQFRDPVSYIFAKQRIWRDFIRPKTRDKAGLSRGLAALAAIASLAISQTVKELTSGVASEIAKYTGPVLAGASAVLAALPTDTYAELGGADDWIDQLFGTPIERTIGDPKKRDEKHYGYVGQFFQYFIEGITHLLFATEITNKVSGDWAKINRIPEANISAVFEEFFTQYYPHEHTDQPPYVWDASLRPKYPHLYGPSKRQRNLVDREVGVMNAVDNHYIQYLSEGLSDLEQEWRKIKPGDTEARRKLLVRMGKLLHGVEDWYFHSNVVELIRLRGHKPAQRDGEDDEEFARRFVGEALKQEPVFINADKGERLRLQRRLYRRLRFPTYERGTKTNSAGIVSKKVSTLSLHHAYPAFPSQQDTAHTLLGALENLERKGRHPSSPTGRTEVPPWAPCVIRKFYEARDGDGRRLVEEKARARGVSTSDVISGLLSSGGPARDKVEAVIIDVLREWMPLVVTLLNESERQRLVANVDPLHWPVGSATPARLQGESGEKTETDKQLERHKEALEPKANAEGIGENNYERAVRYLGECGFLNARGQNALVTAFEIDQKSQKLLKEAPGSGGFLMQFAVELQRALDEGDAAGERLNKKESSLFDQASDNRSFTEIVGSHSLMSKDTPTSSPFYDDAKVLASVASMSVFRIMLEQISAPAGERRLPWKLILQHFIRFPVAAGGWERRAIAYFRENNGRIPRYEDLPELARLVESALRSSAALAPWHKGPKEAELQERYIKLESEVSKYRYPWYRYSY
jgi:hypothetical protein